MKSPFNIFAVFHWPCRTSIPIHIGFLQYNPFNIGLWYANNGHVLGKHIAVPTNALYNPHTVYKMVPLKHYPIPKKLKP